MKVRITPRDRNNIKDKKTAKLLEKMIEHEYEKFKGILDALVSARAYIQVAYGIDTPNRIWERIMEEVIKYDISILSYQEGGSK